MHRHSIGAISLDSEYEALTYCSQGFHVYSFLRVCRLKNNRMNSETKKTYLNDSEIGDAVRVDSVRSRRFLEGSCVGGSMTPCGCTALGVDIITMKTKKLC